jgi:integrase/recombinase XerD
MAVGTNDVIGGEILGDGRSGAESRTLFGRSASPRAAGSPWAAADDPWARCVADFLEAKARRSGSSQTRDHYRRTLQAFAAVCSTHPSRVSPAEIQAFAHAPARRRGRGGIIHECPATPATIARRLAILSSFYAFACKQLAGHDAAGRPVPLCTYNPAAAVERPRVDPYRQVRGLSDVQARALLRAIPRDTPLGLRDYAVLSMYLYTGRRREEIARLRWGDIEPHAGGYAFRYRGKGGKSGRRELPQPAARALLDYLRDTGRLGTIGPDDPLWLPHGTGGVKRADGALTSNAIYRRLKHYARLAGLDPRTLSLHGLRHTGAKLRRQVGAGIEEVQRFLDHTSVATTQIYLRATEAVGDPLAAKVATLLESDEGPWP